MSRVVIISLDGASWNVLGPLTEDSTMGFLSSLMNKGSYGVLESVIPPVTAPAWSSFMTGKNPDKHGVYEFRCFDIEDKKDYITNASYIQSETIWQILSRHNKKIISINVPYTYPVYEVNGIMVSGMDTPSDDSEYCYPPSLKRVIKERFPEYVPVMKAWDMKDVANENKAIAYIDKLLELINLRVRLASYLLNEYEWDLAMLHIQETDYIQHVLWDNIIEVIKSDKDSILYKKIRSFYRSIDASLRNLLEGIGSDDVNIFIISDHGCTSHRGVIYPNVLLEKEDILKRDISDSLRQRLKERLRESDNPLVRGLYKFQKNARSIYKRDLSDLIVGEKLKIQQSIDTLPVRWDDSMAVMIMGSQYAFIHIRDDVGKRCKEILLNLRDKRSNMSLFKDVVTIGEAYGREETDPADILVAIAQDGYSVSRGFKGTVLGESYYPGIHHPDGIYIGCGRDIKEGVRDGLDLIDIVPTCLRLLEVPLVEDMDGRVAYSIIKRHKTDKYDRSVYIEHEKKEYTEKDQRLIEERLKTLGYI
jgi:predicted AlkP superfamily phosphohydrolase/phosphomutase